MKHTALWLVGGISVGIGIVLAATGGFGVPGGDANQVYGTLGYDGIDDIAISGQGIAAVLLFAVGVGSMMLASATAWRQTGGY